MTPSAGTPSLEIERVAAWRMSRHRLTKRAPRSDLADVVSGIGGLHAQVMSSADLSLWARMSGHKPGDLDAALWERRDLVKTWSLRGTLHLLTAEDLPLFVAALSTYRPWERAYWQRGFKVKEGDVEAIVDAVTAALDGRTLTREELSSAVTANLGKRLGERLRSGWGEFLKPAARLGRLCFGPSRGRNVTFVRPDQWLGRWRELDPHDSLREVARRYLAAYGPATHEEFARWIGTDPPPARRLFKEMASELEEVQRDGRPAYALPGTAREIRRARAGSSVRLVPAFDPYVIGSHPREAVTPAAFAARVFRKGAWVSPVVLVGGAAVAVWEQRARAKRLELEVRPFGRLDAATRKGIEGEAARLARFVGSAVDVRIAR